MPDMEFHSFDEDLDTVVDRLVSDRPRLAPVDLDRIKLQALGRGVSHGFVPGPVRRRILAPIVTMGLMGGGTAAVLAAGDAAKKPPKPQCVQYDSHGNVKIDKKTGEPKLGTCKPPKPPKP
jgi:hypothetical protein